MKALVTGASGFIGLPLVQQLVSRGNTVVAATRRAAVDFPPAVERKALDLATGEGVNGSLFDGADVVFHCAGELRDPARMTGVHVEGTRRLLEALGRTGRTDVRWVQLSSVGAYGPPARPAQPRVVDETSPERPVGEYEVTKTESDRLVARAAAEGLLTLATLRPANVVGPRMPNASLPKIIRLIKQRLFLRVGAPGAIANYVHVDDVVAALIACAEHPKAAGQVFNISSDCTWDALIARIAEVSGVRPPSVRLPEGLLRVLGGRLGARLGNPLTAARLNALVGRTRYPIGKLESMLGFRLRTPMPAGIDALARDAG